MKALPNIFYTMPKHASTTMTEEDLRELLLATDGWIFACGRMYDINSKLLGASVYKVWLEERN